jgi:hypothetical protein
MASQLVRQLIRLGVGGKVFLCKVFFYQDTPKHQHRHTRCGPVIAV